MISRVQYGGKKKTIKDGKEVEIAIPPPIVLQAKGPMLKLVITQPRTIAQKLKEQSKEIPSVSVNGLIDTGAFGCVVTPKVVQDLNLIQTGFQKVTSVQDAQDRPAYYAFLQFPWGAGKEVSVVECPLKGYDCIIGRNILRHWYMTYNGLDGSVIICD